MVPLIGGLVAGDRQAYSYLPHSTVEFPPPAALGHLMEQAGLRNVFYQSTCWHGGDPRGTKLGAAPAPREG